MSLVCDISRKGFESAGKVSLVCDVSRKGFESAGQVSLMCDVCQALLTLLC